MTAEPRQQVVEQRRPIGLGADFALQARRRPQGRRAAARGRAGLPRPAASRASARAKSGIALSARAHALAADRVLVQPRDQRQARSIAARSVSGAAMSSQSSRRPAAVWQRSISPSRLPATPPLTERVSSRLSRVAASIAMWLDAGDPARRVEQHAGAFLGRVEIGEQAAGRGEFGAGRRAESVERRQAEARLQRALAGEAVEPAFARGGRARRESCSSAIVSAGRQPRQFGGQLAGTAGDQLEPAGRNVGGGDRPVLAGAADRREPVGGRRFEQRLLGQRSRCDQPDDRAVDQRLGAARLARLGRAFDLLGNGDAVAALISRAR